MSPTGNYTSIIDIQAQILRDGQPFTRPTWWNNGRDDFVPGKVATWKLHPGAASNGELVNLTVVNMGFISPNWISVKALIAIDNIPWQEPLPGQLFVHDHEKDFHPGVFSCVIHFPHLATAGNLRGVHSLLLRASRVVSLSSSPANGATNGKPTSSPN